MTKEQLEIALTETIVKGLRHEHYDRVCQVADFAYKINTGLNQKEFIICYRTESDTQQENRVSLTNSYTPFIAGQIESVYKKAERSDNVQKQLYHTDETVLTKLQNKTEFFHGKKSFENYLNQRLRYYYFNDPNAWLLFDRRTIVDSFNEVSDFKFYPFEVSSKQAINYYKDNGEVKWLIIQHDKPGPALNKVKNHTKPPESNLPPKRTKKEVEKEVEVSKLKTFYIYAADCIIKYDEFKKEDLDAIQRNPEIDIDTTVLFDPDDESKKMYFTRQVFSNGSKEFPGLQMGNIPDLITRGETYVTPLQKGRGILLDIMRDKSFLDITKAKHTFLQKLVYSQPCDHEHSVHGSCSGGCYEDTDIECKKCHGKGEKWHTSDQEILAVRLPEEGTPVPLSTFAAYIQLPHETPKFLSEELAKELSLVEQAVFNTQVLRNPVFGKTATEVVQLNENVYDALYEFGTLISESYCLGIRICSQYLGKDQGLKVFHKFGRDFRLKDAATRIADYRAAREAGIDGKTLQELGYQVTQKVFQDDPKILSEIKAFDCFKPFADKTVQEIAFIFQDRELDDGDRVLYENFDKITKAINYNLNNNDREKKVHFSDLPLDKQKELIDAEVEKIKKTINPLNGIKDVEIVTD